MLLQTIAVSSETGVKNSKNAIKYFPYNPATLLLAICLKDSTPYSIDTCSTMFTITLFTIVMKYK